MFGQLKMSSPSGDFSVASHVDRSHTLSFLNLQPNPLLQNYKFLSLCKNTNENDARISQLLSQYFGWSERRLDRAKISLAGHRALPLSIKHFENCLVKICGEKSLINCFRYDFQPSKLGRSFEILWGAGEWEFQKKDFLVKRNVFETVYWSFQMVG